MVSHPLMIGTHRRYRRCAGVASAYEADRLVLMDSAGKRFYSTNAVGAHIWDLLGTARTTENLCAELRSRWEPATEGVVEDVRAFLEAMQAANLVEAIGTDGLR